MRMTLRLENNAQAQPFIGKNFRNTLRHGVMRWPGPAADRH
jgi:hypothetical protein